MKQVAVTQPYSRDKKADPIRHVAKEAKLKIYKLAFSFCSSCQVKVECRDFSTLPVKTVFNADMSLLSKSCFFPCNIYLQFIHSTDTLI